PFVLLCVGLGSAWLGSSYDVGTLTAMGPGFLPVALGLCLALLAALLLWLEKPADVTLPLPPRPIACVSAGIIAWVLLADTAGFFAAGLAQVLLSSLALPGQKWTTVVVIAIVLNIAAYALFVVILGLPLPAFGN
ncbi:MAG: tripartite tricarboxylate transporter TctB family protein, partial [Pseudomonadota bacterium]|nr:tripartite tricarboxylate transporter TctB family protein [Pseudomonadota bacterium]